MNKYEYFENPNFDSSFKCVYPNPGFIVDRLIKTFVEKFTVFKII